MKEEAAPAAAAKANAKREAAAPAAAAKAAAKKEKSLAVAAAKAASKKERAEERENLKEEHLVREGVQSASRKRGRVHSSDNAHGSQQGHPSMARQDGVNSVFMKI